MLGGEAAEDGVSEPEVVVTWLGYAPGGESDRLLKSLGLRVVHAPGHGRTRSSSEMCELLANARAAIVSTEPIDSSVFAAAKQLRVVARSGVGIDTIDVAAATAAGVAVTIAAGTNEETCADHTLALMLAAVRRIVENHENLRAGSWDRIGATTPWDLHGTTVGIIGFGRIGQAVARRLRGFDVSLLVHDIREVPEQGIEFVGLEELLSRSRLVSLHCPLGPGTRGLIGRAQLEMMRPEAILVNTARGELIDASALYEALVNGRLRAAGLDVFDTEPPRALSLASLPNVVVSPHIGGISDASIERLTFSAVRSVVDILSGRVPDGLVNPAALQNGRILAGRSDGVD